MGRSLRPVLFPHVLRAGRGTGRIKVLGHHSFHVDGKTMDRPPPLSVIQLGDEWIVTNGQLAADGVVRFPEEDPAKEAFGTNCSPPANMPGKPSALCPNLNRVPPS